MPVAFRLSKKFSDTFGEDIADEFVNWFNQVDTAYRSELHEQNERNWARFDFKLEQRAGEIRADIGGLRAEFKADLADFRTEIKTDLAELRSELKMDTSGLRTELKTDMSGLRTELKTEMADFRTELKTEMADFRTDIKTEMAGLRADMASFKAELIKWMFLFWLGTVGTTVAVVQLLL